MRPLTTSELLTIWEYGLDKPLLEKTLLLLGKACDVKDYRELGNISIGDRDARLLLLRRWMFGDRMQYVSACPHCKEKVEWEANSTQLQIQPISNDLFAKKTPVELRDYSIEMRLPNSNDIRGIAFQNNTQNAEMSLLKNCLTEIRQQQKPIAFEQLPKEVLQEIIQKMAETDPQADVTMQPECPNCKTVWEAPFDIMSFLWAEINSWAQKTMREIFLLAKAFSWPEREILNLTPRRRQLYLQMIGA